MGSDPACHSSPPISDHSVSRGACLLFSSMSPELCVAGGDAGTSQSMRMSSCFEITSNLARATGHSLMRVEWVTWRVTSSPTNLRSTPAPSQPRPREPTACAKCWRHRDQRFGPQSLTTQEVTPTSNTVQVQWGRGLGRGALVVSPSAFHPGIPRPPSRLFMCPWPFSSFLGLLCGVGLREEDARPADRRTRTDMAPRRERTGFGPGRPP